MYYIYIYHEGIMTKYDGSHSPIYYHDKVEEKMTDSSVIITYCTSNIRNDLNIYIGSDIILSYYHDSNDNLNFICYATDISLQLYSSYGYIINDFIAAYSDDIKNLNTDAFDIITNKILNTFPLYVEICNKFKENITYK